MTIATISGILMMIGSYLTIMGMIYYAVMVYLFVDVLWIVQAIQNNDDTGIYFAIAGVIMAFVAFVKMHIGMMDKSLK